MAWPYWRPLTGENDMGTTFQSGSSCHDAASASSRKIHQVGVTEFGSSDNDVAAGKVSLSDA
jgi:hypothetical protein